MTQKLIINSYYEPGDKRNRSWHWVKCISNSIRSLYIKTTQGSGMDKPKSSWSCSQNSPPDAQKISVVLLSWNT